VIFTFLIPSITWFFHDSVGGCRTQVMQAARWVENGLQAMWVWMKVGKASPDGPLDAMDFWEVVA